MTHETIFAYGLTQLRSLLDSLGFADQQEEVIRLFKDLCILCKYRDLKLPPRWSGVGDDCTPFEFSIIIHEGQPYIRILVEAQDDPASPLTYWNAGLKLNEWLYKNLNVNLEGFHKIKDLFIPTDPLAYWAIWHGIDFPLNGPPRFKLYLNPLAQGIKRSDIVVSEAIYRLGFSHLWSTLSSLRGSKDTFTFLSIDLSTEREARLKVYIRHWDATLDELETRCAVANGSIPGEWSSFCKAITGDQKQLSYRPIFSVYHLTSEVLDRPARSVLVLPLHPYVENDLVAYNRIRYFLSQCGLSSEAYSGCVEALSNGSLDRNQGLHSWISYQREMGKPRITVYFSPRVYYQRYGWLALNPQHCWPSPVCTESTTCSSLSP